MSLHPNASRRLCDFSNWVIYSCTFECRLNLLFNTRLNLRRIIIGSCTFMMRRCQLLSPGEKLEVNAIMFKKKGEREKGTNLKNLRAILQQSGLTKKWCCRAVSFSRLHYSQPLTCHREERSFNSAYPSQTENLMCTGLEFMHIVSCLCFTLNFTSTAGQSTFLSLK